MGLFSFIKEAGAKAFGKKSKSEEALTDQAEIEHAEQELNKRAGAGMVERIEDLGLEAEDLKINIVGDKAIVSGKPKNQSTREKIILVVGNNEGIAQVDDQMTVTETEPEAEFYTVKSGDNLSSIAKNFYDNAMKYPVIFEANKPMLKDPDKIYPGQVLRIPKVE